MSNTPNKPQKRTSKKKRPKKQSLENSAPKKMGPKSKWRQENLDLSVIENMLIIGCTGQEIAFAHKVHTETLKNFVKEKTGKNFRDYSRIHREGMGNVALRRLLWREANKGKMDAIKILLKTRLGIDAEAPQVNINVGGDSPEIQALKEKYRDAIDAEFTVKSGARETSLATTS